jgi:hypothetical protein
VECVAIRLDDDGPEKPCSGEIQLLHPSVQGMGVSVRQVRIDACFHRRQALIARITGPRGECKKMFSRVLTERRRRSMLAAAV